MSWPRPRRRCQGPRQQPRPWLQLRPPPRLHSRRWFRGPQPRPCLGKANGLRTASSTVHGGRVKRLIGSLVHDSGDGSLNGSLVHSNRDLDYNLVHGGKSRVQGLALGLIRGGGVGRLGYGLFQCLSGDRDSGRGRGAQSKPCPQRGGKAGRGKAGLTLPRQRPHLLVHGGTTSPSPWMPPTLALTQSIRSLCSLGKGRVRLEKQLREQGDEKRRNKMRRLATATAIAIATGAGAKLVLLVLCCFSEHHYNCTQGWRTCNNTLYETCKNP